MRIALFIILLAIGIVLFVAKKWIDDDKLQRLAHAFTVVAFVAAALVFVVPTPAPPEPIAEATVAAPTLASTPTPTYTPSSTLTSTPLGYEGWVICWHGTDGHEVLVAYPESNARNGIELILQLERPWSGDFADLANDSLKMCFANGIWYGGIDTNSDPPWYPQVSYLQLREDHILVCEDTPGCNGQQWMMASTGSPPFGIESLLRQPTSNEIQTLGFISSDVLR